MRDFIGDMIRIDGRMIPYKIFTASQYLQEKERYSEEEIEKLYDKKYEMCQMINQIMAIKQACFLLRRTSYSCGSLSDDLYDLKIRLIGELKAMYNFDFDDDFVENNGLQIKKECSLWK